MLQECPPPLPLPGNVLALGGHLRTRGEDFIVEELPLYEPAGRGEHVLALVEKRGLSTSLMVERLARALKIKKNRVGVAGLKDRQAVVRQWVSVRGVDPATVLKIELPGVAVLRAGRHPNKLKTGHLRGNRFCITVRETRNQSEELLQQAVRRIGREGMPNGFGPQRFGRDGENHLLGEMLLYGEVERFWRRITRPREGEGGPWAAGRALLQAKHWSHAARTLPSEMLLERHLALAMRAKPEDRTHALRSLPARQKSYLASAWQSACFNRLLEERLASWGHFLPGDVAMKHDNGACFLVEEPEREAQRLERLEISPTGPLPGRKMLKPSLVAGHLEEQVLEACGWGGVPPDSLLGARLLRGSRRPLRVPVAGLVLERPDDRTAVLRFSLPRGSFATVLLALFGVPGKTEDGQDPSGIGMEPPTGS